MTRFGFAPARPEERIVYGAQRPGYSSQSVDASHVSDWISFVHKNGVRRVCCLLPDNQLAYYSVDLLKAYCEAFGESNVCHAPIEDYHLCDHRTTTSERYSLSSKRLMPRASRPSSTAPAVSGEPAMSWPCGSSGIERSRLMKPWQLYRATVIRARRSSVATQPTKSYVVC